MDNFAAAFLHIGAGAVFAYGSNQRLNLPRELMLTERTVDQIFSTRVPNGRRTYSGFVGWRDYYRRSRRTPGARIHLVPHPRRGHYRAVTGNLRMTTASWRGEYPLQRRP